MKVAELQKKPGLKAVYNDGFEYELNGFRFRVNGMTESGFQKMDNAYAAGSELVLDATDFEPDASVVSAYYVGE